MGCLWLCRLSLFGCLWPSRRWLCGRLEDGCLELLSCLGCRRLSLLGCRRLWLCGSLGPCRRWLCGSLGPCRLRRVECLREAGRLALEQRTNVPAPANLPDPLLYLHKVLAEQVLPGLLSQGQLLVHDCAAWLRERERERENEPRLLSERERER